ncbi:MAG: PTS sugar transporter subunit IIA [candidate division Zixibacteria bacterium]|nr:PTS sugar transporter subunit IIA [candidate division Zixibacteria bacterium]
MKLSSIIDPDLIKIDMKASSKEDAIEQLAGLFCKKYPEKSKDEILKAVSEREKLSSTSMGRGVAFPHARTDIVNGLSVIIGVIPDGLAIDAPDNKPLHVIVLLLTPRNISKNYLQTLSGLAAFSRLPETVPSVLNAKSPKELIEYIDRTNIMIKKVLTIGDVMTPDPITIKTDKTLKDVANVFFKHNLRCLPVVDNDNKLVGEITGTELLKYALPNYKSFIANVANLPEIESFEELLQKEHSAKVSNFMNPNPIIVDINAPVVEAAAMMLFKKVEMVSVLAEGKLAGVITKTDIVSKIIRG